MKREGDIKHGTRYAYTARNCRCEMCVDADRAYKRAYYRVLFPLKQKRDPFISKLSEHVHHGTRTAYNNYACRCELCLESCREYSRMRRLRSKGI